MTIQPPEYAPTPEERERTLAKIEPMIAEMKTSEADDKAALKALHLAQVEKANKINAERMIAEAEAAGVEPFADAEKTIPVSLSLRRLLKQQADDDVFLNASFEAAQRRANA